MQFNTTKKMAFEKNRQKTRNFSESYETELHNVRELPSPSTTQVYGKNNLREQPALVSLEHPHF